MDFPSPLPGPLSRRRFLAALPACVALNAATASAQDPAASTSSTPAIKITPPRIRIGQIGTKHGHAAGKLETILKFPDLYELIGVVEPDKERRAAIANTAPYAGICWLDEDALLSTTGLKAVAVETPVAELAPTALRCLSAGIHIHLDKPAGGSLDQCRAIHALAQKRALTVQMGYMLRYNPAFAFAHRILREGWLGEVTELSGMMGKTLNDAGRLQLAEFSGGGMFELGCHLIDQVVSLMGPPQKVTAHTRRSFSKKDSFADNQLAVFDYPNATATIRTNFIDPFGGPRRQFSITGTQGTLEIRPLEPQPLARLALEKPHDRFSAGYQDVSFERTAGRYDAEFIDFARVIRGEKRLAWDAAHDIATHETVLRASGML